MDWLDDPQDQNIESHLISTKDCFVILFLLLSVYSNNPTYVSSENSWDYTSS